MHEALVLFACLVAAILAVALLALAFAFAGVPKSPTHRRL